MLRAFARLLLRICFSRRTLKIACLLLLVAGATILLPIAYGQRQQTADRSDVNAFRRVTWVYCWGRGRVIATLPDVLIPQQRCTTPEK